jgi:DNA (cytosine-5)-methyltransferase 1
MKKVTLEQASKLLGISPNILRSWEKKKLIQGEKKIIFVYLIWIY